MADEETDSGPLFGGIVFTIIPSDDLEEWQSRTLIESIETSGGMYIPLREGDLSIDRIDEITHVISSHTNFPEYLNCLDYGICVVKPTWVSASIAKKKQAAPRQYSPDPNQYFQDVVLACADIPDGDKDAIQAGVIALGGQVSRSLTKIVTHIVTNNLDNQMCATAEQKRHQCNIVLPHWFDACIKLGKKINEKPYLLPDPEILRSDNGNVRPPPTPQLEGAASAFPTGELLSTPPPSPSKTRKFLNAFMMKKVYLSEDLNLSDHLVKTLVSLIEHGGGEITRDVNVCNIYVCQYREGSAYLAASRAGKQVGNLSWLYYVINNNTYSSPLSKLLHYPVPRHPIPGFEHMKISLSNYSGDARVYVENLIKYCGAEYTKTMKQDNTHLVTATKTGEKCEAAQEWNINVVNHLWLEESFAKCAIQSLTNPKYTFFPARTNLGEVAGQTALDMKTVERIFFPKPKSPQKPKGQEKPAIKQSVPACSVMPDHGLLVDDIDVEVSAPVDEDDDMEDAEEEAPKPKKGRGRPRKSGHTETPRIKAGEDKENESPMLAASTGRASKQKALSSLHNGAADIALYQRESKRKGGVVYGGRRSSHTEDVVSSPVPLARNSKKRPSDEYDATAVGSDLSDGETQPPGAKPKKKAKTGPSPTLPEIEYRMMVTGDDRWQSNTRKESADKSLLRQLGVQVSQDPKEVDILVAPKLLRTKKFVCALAGAPLVVNTSFLDTALSKKKLVENPPLLKDRDGEERLGFKLADSLKRAKVNKRQLFRGWTIYMTRDVKGGFETYKDIVTLNGGTALLYAGRIGITLASRPSADDADSGAESQNQGGEDELNCIYLVSGTSDNEMKLWKTFRDLAKKQDLEARIVSPDWVLNAALGQEITFEQKWLLDEKSVMSQRAG